MEALPHLYLYLYLSHLRPRATAKAAGPPSSKQHNHPMCRAHNSQQQRRKLQQQLLHHLLPSPFSDSKAQLNHHTNLELSAPGLLCSQQPPLAHQSSEPPPDAAVLPPHPGELMKRSLSVPQRLDHAAGGLGAQANPPEQQQPHQLQQPHQQQPQQQQQGRQPPTQSLAEVSALRRTTAMLLRRMLRLELTMQAQAERQAGDPALMALLLRQQPGEGPPHPHHQAPHHSDGLGTEEGAAVLAALPLQVRRSK